VWFGSGLWWARGEGGGSRPPTPGYSSDHSLLGDLTIGSPACSDVPGTGYRRISPRPSTAASTSLPAAVVLYLCILLVGLAGTVISIQAASNRGLRTWFLNSVRFVLPITSITPV